MKKVIVKILTAGVLAMLVGCSPSKQDKSNTATLINGAGSTFDNPAFTKWFSVYQSSVDPQRSVQLSVHRFRRRAAAVAQANRGLRSLGCADDRRDAWPAPRARSCISRWWRAAWRSFTTCRATQTETRRRQRWPAIYLGDDHQLERFPNRGAESRAWRCQICRLSSCTGPTAAARHSSSPIT